MPKEKFYNADRVEGDGLPADLEVSWASPGNVGEPGVRIGGLVNADRSGINRLIRVLRRARDQVYGSDEGA